ncbi:MAG: hypothetical protein J0G29_00360 [Alphaproteobacteria bacterium]|nr:hypothetical protein [Alphaproteobacteria bacterium]OJV47962.1 MAG: hypothetical protein BGO28_03800 [Alphaproteobacteria bacterium 43-37]
MNSYGTHQIQISEIFWTQPLQELEDAVLARIPVLQNKETRTTAQEAEDVVSRMMHAARRRIGERFKGMAPSFLRGVIYLRNQYMYSDPLGPTYEYLRKKGKTAGSIIESAKRTGGENLGLKSPFILSLLNAIDSGLKLVGLL